MEAWHLVPLYCYYFVLYYAPGLLVVHLLGRRVQQVGAADYLPLAALFKGVLGYVAFWVYFLLSHAEPNARDDLRLGPWFTFLIGPLGSIGWLVAELRAGFPLFRNPLSLRILLLTFLNGLVYLAIVFACIPSEPSHHPDHLLAGRYKGPQRTRDPDIPLVFARILQDRAEDNREPIIGDWRSSDRPPLQTGLVLLYPDPRLGHVDSPAQEILSETRYHFHYQINGTIMQLSCLPVICLLILRLSSLAWQQRTMLVTLLFSGFFYFNSVFVWPKLLAAGYTLFALDLLLLREKRRAVDLILAAVSAALAMLAHPGSLFLLLPLALVVICTREAYNWAWLLLAGGLAVAILVPWILYQKLYDPPGDALILHHFSGLGDLNDLGELRDRSVLQITWENYTKTPLSTLLRHRVNNFLTLFGPVFPDPGTKYSTDVAQQWQLGRYSDLGRKLDFHYLFFALGPLNLGWLVALAYWFRGVRPDGAFSHHAWLLVRLTLASLGLWCLLLFQGGMTIVSHASSATIILVFLLAGLAVSMGKYRFPARLAIGCIVINLVLLWGVFGINPNWVFQGSNAVFAGMGLLGLLLILLSNMAPVGYRIAGNSPALDEREPN